MLIGMVKSKGWDEAIASLNNNNCNNNNCKECNKPNPPVEYKDNKYCNWYCAKKENK